MHSYANRLFVGVALPFFIASVITVILIAIFLGASHLARGLVIWIVTIPGALFGTTFHWSVLPLLGAKLGEVFRDSFGSPPWLVATLAPPILVPVIAAVPLEGTMMTVSGLILLAFVPLKRAKQSSHA